MLVLSTLPFFPSNKYHSVVISIVCVWHKKKKGRKIQVTQVTPYLTAVFAALIITVMNECVLTDIVLSYILLIFLHFANNFFQNISLLIAYPFNFKIFVAHCIAVWFTFDNNKAFKN